MKLPTNPDFYRKLVLAAVLFATAFYLQLTTGSIPAEVLSALATLVVFLLGVSTQAHLRPPERVQKVNRRDYRD